VTDYDPAKAAEEINWLLAHPHFEEKPASIKEFVGEGYLEIESLIRPGLLEALVNIFGEEVNGDLISHYERAMLTGAIGIGKTTFASIALPYMAHWVLCLKNPQAYFGLLPGSRIAFMQMSTSEQQAAQVVFGDIFARIKHSPWFVTNYPYDDKFTKQIRFAKDIWILPGDSAETTFEGYNILGGILDEMDSHKITPQKDYAELGYNTINSRIASRFTIFGGDGEDAGNKGLLICIGQMKKSNGFAQRKYNEYLKDKKAYVVRMTIWDSFGWERYTKNGKRLSFWYDTKRKQIIPTLVAGVVKNKDLLEVPNAYRNQFENKPEQALRDLAGIPPATSDPFISLVDRIEDARDRWIERNGAKSPVKPNPTRIEFEKWFTNLSSDTRRGDPRKRHIHIDLATSGDGDALGMAMGHVESIVEMDDEKKPYIVIDCLMRIKASAGTEIMLSDVRQIVYYLRNELKFRVYSVSMDGFQSTDTMQQLRKKKFMVDYLSCDRSTLPYEDLREAIYERRIEIPPYLTYMNKGDTDLVEVAIKELMELTDTGKKIDHPPDGSKDLADCLAGVASTLMGDRTYSRGVLSVSASSSGDTDLAATGTTGRPANANVLPFPGLGGGLQAPLPPSTGGAYGLDIPSRLQSRPQR
jgi:hypothetical protein